MHNGVFFITYNLNIIQKPYTTHLLNTPIDNNNQRKSEINLLSLGHNHKNLRHVVRSSVDMYRKYIHYGI